MKARGASSRTAVWTGAALAVGLSALAFSGWTLARDRARKDLHSDTELTGHLVQGRIKGCINTRVELVAAMGREWAAGGLRSEQEFAIRADSTTRSLSGFQAVNRIDANGSIVQVHPTEGNESALGKSVTDNPIAGPFLQEAGSTQQLRLTSPLKLFQGGQGFAAYAPLVSEGRVAGYFNGVFRADEAIAACLAHGEPPGYVVGLSDAGEPLVAMPEVPPEGLTSSFEFPIRNRSWTLLIAPNEGLLRRRSGPGRLALLGWLMVAMGLSVVGGWVRLLLDRRRDLEQKSREDVHRLVAMVDSSQDAIILMDLEFRVIYRNETARTLAARNDADPEKSSVFDLFPLSSERLREHLEKTVAQGHAAIELGLGAGLPGLYAVRSALVMRANSDQADAIALAATDVSERSRLDRELAQARKMEALGRLAGGVAHDFNNLLTVIVANVADLRETETRAREVTLLEEVSLASVRAAGLTRQLLSLGRSGIQKFGTIDSGKVVLDLEPLLRRLLRDDIELQLSVAEDLPMIRGDKTRLEQIVINLSMNAADAISGSGLVAIALDEDAEGIRLAVSDDGCGMKPEVTRHIFEPFFTTKSVNSGTGLGLATVYANVAAMNGTISVESKPDAGTVMLIRFAAADARASRPSNLPLKDQRRSPHSQPDPACILLVEDNELVRGAVERILSDEGHQVAIATDGEEAIRYLEEHAADLDLVITDAIMPKLGGAAVFDWVSEHQPGLPVVVASGYASTELDQEALSRRGAHFLPKPYEPDDLLAMIKRVRRTTAPRLSPDC